MRRLVSIKIPLQVRPIQALSSRRLCSSNLADLDAKEALQTSLQNSLLKKLAELLAEEDFADKDQDWVSFNVNF